MRGGPTSQGLMPVLISMRLHPMMSRMIFFGVCGSAYDLEPSLMTATLELYDYKMVRSADPGYVAKFSGAQKFSYGSIFLPI